MYQFASKNQDRSEKSKTNASTTNRRNMQTGIKIPVQTKSLFSPSFNQENIADNQQPASIRPNNTGIPTPMKSRFETLSGFSFDDVKVHYNSDKPKQLQALAYTQGNQVYIAPGQEKHLGHELGHVVQQKQGWVKPTMQLQGMPVNDDVTLEVEADELDESIQMISEEKLLEEEDETSRMRANGGVKISTETSKIIQPKLKVYKPKAISTNDEQECHEVAKVIDSAVESAYSEFISGNYDGASKEQVFLYVRRKNEYDEAKASDRNPKMHPSTAAGYVIEGKVNQKIGGIQGVETQVTGVIKGSRPDISVQNGKGLIDITAEKSLGHIYRKANWFGHSGIVYVAESYYESINFDTMKPIVLSDEQKEAIERYTRDKQVEVDEHNQYCLEHYHEHGNLLQNKMLENSRILGFGYCSEGIEQGTRRSKDSLRDKFRKFGFEGSIDSILIGSLRNGDFLSDYGIDSRGLVRYSISASELLYNELMNRLTTRNWFGPL